MGINMVQYQAIPGPPGKPLVGNIFDIDPGASSTSFFNMAKKYGEICKIHVLGEDIIFLNSAALIGEVSTDENFRKLVEGGLLEMRHALHNGLLTADTSDPAWHSAHRIAMPGLTPLKIREMFEDMKDIVSQLCLKWARLGPSHAADANTEFTRMALDVIGLCGMGYRFNAFYDQTDSHPIALALTRVLKETEARQWRIPIMTSLNVVRKKRFLEDINYMRGVCQDLVDHRRAKPDDRVDILNALLNGVDAETGEKMNDSSIIDNLLTFLGAGHETTSGTLSFILYFLLQNPAALVKAQREIDEVIGEGSLEIEHLSKLPYLDAVIRETLRFHPTVPVYARTCDEDQVLGGKYFIKKNTAIIPNLFASQRDTAVYGDDADQWKPERMLGEKFKQLPPGAWRPFGMGIRACIGRSFAWQETQIALAMLLHTFNFEAADPNYTLKCKDAVTLNPIGFKVRPHLRDHKKYTALLRGRTHASESLPYVSDPGSASANAGSGKPMTVLYGSDQGTAHSLAHLFATHAARRGYHATVETLNTAKENLPKGQPVVIVTSSYNGEPPLTAAHFVSWLESLAANEAEGLSYAVFGCGHRDWSRTFQRIPTLIDNLLNARGGTRIVPLGSTDAFHGEVLSDFQDWEDEIFWPTLLSKDKDDIAHDRADGNGDVVIPGLISPQRDLSKAYVSRSTLLTSPGTPQKMHTEFDLPTGSAYSVGDYMVIAAVNSPEVVERCFSRFRLSWDSELQVNPSSREDGRGTKYLANEVFSHNVELLHPASSRNIKYLITMTDDPKTKEELSVLAEQNSSKQLSVLDILEQNPSINLSVEQFLSLLPPLLVRTYSISSSPLYNPAKATITYSVVTKSTGNPQIQKGAVLGVASNYLAGLPKGALVRQSIRTPRTNFSLPSNPDTTPVIMICAGSGIAPFRGFIQERHIMQTQRGHGQEQGSRSVGLLAPALLFFGCRSPDLDDLYRQDLDGWQNAGAVTVYRAYSRPAASVASTTSTASTTNLTSVASVTSSNGNGHINSNENGSININSNGSTNGNKKRMYVQDLLKPHGTEIKALWERGARVYVCGAAKMAEQVKTVFEEVVFEGLSVAAAADKDKDEDEDERSQMMRERFAVEIFS